MHAVQAERALLEMGDHVADMLKCNQALSATAMTLIDATRKLLDAHADNGQGLHTLTKFEKDPGPAAGVPGSHPSSCASMRLLLLHFAFSAGTCCVRGS